VAITVQAAFNEQGLANGRFAQGRFDQVANKLSRIFLRTSRPMQMAVRNIMRRKARLVLTLLTLTLGSAIFIGVMSVHASLLGALDDALTYFAFDVTVDLTKAYSTAEVEQLALQVPGVVQVESWIEGDAQRLQAGHAGMAFALLGIGSEPQTIQPQMEDGRWLQPDDTNAIVLDSLVLSREPDIQLGDTVTLKIDGLVSEWQVVGFSQSVLTEDGVAYANRDYLAQKIGLVGKANGISVMAADHTPIAQFELDKALREQLNASDVTVAFTEITADIRDDIQFEFTLIILMLVVMAVLLSLVGGLGLTGTMSINVLERTREIGVMRAIGASNRAVRRIVMGEGVAVAVISWFWGSLLAYPLGKLLSDMVGNEVLESALNYHFAADWTGYWLIIICVLALFASFWPAWYASCLSIRETLAYE
jgi:putative ABC transport system permease protein